MASIHERSVTIDLLQVIPFAWLAGVILLLARVALATLRLALLTRNLRPLDDTTSDSLLHDCCHRLGIRSPPALLIGPDHIGPALVGVWRPRLLLPPCVLNFDPSELRLIILHELAHLRRRDVLANYVLSVLQMVHWFNPLVWLAFNRMRAERELACDEMVLFATSPRESRTYASTILKLLELLSQGTVSSAAVGAVQRKAMMHRRIAMIARFDGKPRRQTLRELLLMLGIGIVGAASLVRADPPPPASDAANHPSSAGASEKSRADAALRTIEDPASLRADEQTLEKLRKPTSLALESESLSDALAKVADVAKVDIVTDNRTLARELGADFAKNPVTMRVHEPRPVGDLLQLALRLVSGNLDYAIVDGVVFVSTRDELARHVVTRIYHVDGAGNSEELANAIAQVLRSQAAHPEIQFVGSRLIVTAPEPAQRQIAKLLHVLADPASRADTRPAHADGDQRVAQVYLLKHTDAQHMADVVASVFPAEVKCTADVRSNALVVHAMPEDQQMIERLLSLLDKPERQEHAAASSLSQTAAELLRKYRDTAEQLAIGRAKYGGSSHPEIRLLRVQLNVQGQEIKAILDELVRTGRTEEAASLRRQWQALDTLADATMVGSDGATETRRYNLKSADPKAVAAAVASQCSPAAKISVDPQTKALVVTASAAEQAKVAQALIDKLSPSPVTPFGGSDEELSSNLALYGNLSTMLATVSRRYGENSTQVAELREQLRVADLRVRHIASDAARQGEDAYSMWILETLRGLEPANR